MTVLNFLKARSHEGLALLAGLISALAFSPFDLSYLSFFSLAVLFWSWLEAKPLVALLRGYLFGLGQFAAGISWVYISMHDYGGADWLEAGTLTALLVLFLALYPAMAGYVAARIALNTSLTVKLLAIYPITWVCIEWFRGWFLTGYPWLQFGYSQVSTPLGLGLAPLLGVYGTSLAVSFLAGLILLAIYFKGFFKFGLIAAIPSFFLLCFGLSSIEWTQPAGAPFKVSLLQGNIEQNVKWRPEFQRETLRSYIEMTREHWDSRLIIWPETAVPAFYHQVKETFLHGLQAEAASHHADLLMGIPVIDSAKDDYYNALISLSSPQASAEGGDAGMYFKRHLVPFGEYLPLRPLLGFVLEWLDIPLSDFARGDDHQKALVAAGYPLAASICYEDIFGQESRLGLPEAAYLVNVTNDAWFGDSIAPHQHVQMARMRALETGRYMLRSTNTGVTAVIASDGSIIKQAPMFRRAAISAEMTPMQGATPYVLMGDAPLIFCLFAALVFLKRFA